MKKMAVKEVGKAKFRQMTKEDLVDSFRSQNWKQHQRKEGEKTELMTVEEASDRIGLKAELMDECLAETIKEPRFKKRIIYHIAKAMYYDETNFVETCRALYPWFSEEALHPISSGVESQLTAFRNAENKQDANSKVRNFLGLEGEGDRANIDIEKTVEGGVESHTVAVKIPNKMTSISDMLDIMSSDDASSSAKDDRTSWAARFRTDVFQILKIASATKGQSATKFVEGLILRYAGSQIRETVEALKPDTSDSIAKQAETQLAQDSAKAIYKLLRKNYHNNTTQASFPDSIYKSPNKDWDANNVKAKEWWPANDEVRTYQPGVTQQQAVLILMADLRNLTSSHARTYERHSESMKKLHEYLERIQTADEGADFATMLNQYRGYVDEPEAEVKESQTEE